MFTTVFSMAELNEFETISTENLKANGGTLGLSFYDMLKILFRHNIVPNMLVAKEQNNIVGYCMFYVINKGIHISHICIHKDSQRRGIGNKFVDELERYNPKFITADVSYDNKKSSSFFRKLGFDFHDEQEKHRWNVKKEYGK